MSTEIKPVSPIATPTRRNRVASKACSTPSALSTDLIVRNLTVEHLTILKLTPSSRRRIGSSGDETDSLPFLTPSKKDRVPKKAAKKCSEPYKIEWTESIGTEEVKEHVELAVLVANSNGFSGNDRADAVIKYLDTKLGGDWSCICTSVGRNQTPSGFIKHKHFFYSFNHDDLEWSVWTSEPIRKFQKKSYCTIV